MWSAPRLAGCLIMEPFEISLTFMRVLGKEGNKKNTAQEFFWSVPGRKVLGNTKSSSIVQMFECLLIDLFGTFFIYIVLSVQDFEEGECYLFIFYFGVSCLAFSSSLPHEIADRRVSVVFVLFWHGRTSPSPPHWAQIPAL